MFIIKLKDVELADKPIFDRFFKTGQHHNSECTFTYYYMWRKAGTVQYAVVDDCLCILLDFYGKPYFFPPYGATAANFSAVLQEMERHFEQIGKPFCMRGITKPFIPFFQHKVTGRFLLTPDRDSMDYIYRGSDLRELSGRKYSKKRNHINAFLMEHADYRYLTLSEENMANAVAFIDNWFSKREQSHYFIKEKEGTMEILRDRDALGVKGAVIEINGQVEALTLGEEINNATAVIHIEKANDDIRGLYQMINRDFCQHQWADKQYINREEDMGVAGLRKAKQSYFPLQLLEKYEAVKSRN